MLNFLRSFLAASLKFGSVRYRVVDLDPASSKVTIGVIGKRVICRDDLVNIIADMALISGLSPKDAGWLGFHYGRDLRAGVKHRNHASIDKQVQFNSLSWSKQDRYRILHYGRGGVIRYLHIKTGQFRDDLPLTIIRDDLVLSGFGASSACYLGILSGYDYQKKYVRSNGEDSSVVPFKDTHL